MSSPAATPPGAWRRLRRNPVAIIAAVILITVLAFAVFGLSIFKIDPHATSSAQYAPPSADHFFGTDVNGRDAFARVMEGARISLLVGFCGAFISLFVGTTYGMISGYTGGRTDALMMRFVEILYAIPRLIILILVTFIFDRQLKLWLTSITWKLIISKSLLFGKLAAKDYVLFDPQDLVGYSKIIILIISLGLIEWLTMARIVRGQVLALKSQQFVLAARALGQSHTRIVLRHLLPNLIGIVIIYLTLTIPAVILDESFLSFLGLGVQAPQASWGSLLSEGALVINPVKSYWWLLLFPALVMSVTLLALNFLGDALRDALDPRAKR